MDPSQKNAFGRTAVQVTAMGYGAAPIGNIFRPISEQESQNMIARRGTTVCAILIPRRCMAMV